MSVIVRLAGIADLDEVVDLLLLDAEHRHMTDPAIWKLDANAGDRVRSTVKSAMENDNPPFRQQWLLAETDAGAVGVAHTILLPVPPIYAGDFGAPGLMMEDCFVAKEAPAGTANALLDAAEADLVAAGAKILLGASVTDGAWEAAYAARDHTPLTLYFAKVGLEKVGDFEGVRNATAEDVPAIVTSSAENRKILFDLNAFWKPHREADARFDVWMRKSLTLADRDMFVCETEGEFEGYAISQPSTQLHFPAPHDISAVGFIDDYFHDDFSDPEALDGDGVAARDLLTAAEVALQNRVNDVVLVVCPAAWSSKIDVLKSAGYRTAITWFIKR
ncbi:hypothetical protein [Roseobacter sp. MH60115]|uniref:hypothetical protein n=1 Tax=Roseobacter sp. MH60115 TaxID=2785324 RepID=UPI0018A25373|nr:hypothetical protein [Roseobacter sp. MH60115]